VTAPTPAGTDRLLLDAADRLEELAGAASEGGWHARPDDMIGGWCVTFEDRPPSQGGRQIADFVSEADARWMRAVRPAVAGPLAEVLRDAALLAQSFQAEDFDEAYIASHPMVTPALGVARVVLGVEVPLPDPVASLDDSGAAGPLPGSGDAQELTGSRRAPQMAGEPMSSGVRSGRTDSRPLDRHTGPPIENGVLP
jgi:hypothetical protein